MTHFYVVQKNSDLHSASALSLIQSALGCKSVGALYRYIKWTLDFDSQPSNVANFVLDVTSRSYYLLNPNKEMMVSQLPDRVDTDTSHWVRIEVSQKESDNRDRLKDKINARFNGTLSSVQQSIVWELLVHEKREGYHLPESIQELLANPVHEVGQYVSA